MPIALLPAGSGNALAANTGMWDMATALHAIIKVPLCRALCSAGVLSLCVLHHRPCASACLGAARHHGQCGCFRGLRRLARQMSRGGSKGRGWGRSQGQTARMDVFSVIQPDHPRRFAFLSITFGLIANLDIGTEHLRCCPRSFCAVVVQRGHDLCSPEAASGASSARQVACCGSGPAAGSSAPRASRWAPCTRSWGSACTSCGWLICRRRTTPHPSALWCAPAGIAAA